MLVKYFSVYLTLSVKRSIPSSIRPVFYLFQDYPEVCCATTRREKVSEQDNQSSTLKVTLLGSEWGSSAGGLSTFNRELAIHLAEYPEVDVSLLVPEGACTGEEKIDAQSYNITVVDAKKRPAYDPLDWLISPPKTLDMDVVVGHDVKLGRQAQFIYEKNPNCKWIQVVHTDPEDLSKYKGNSESTSKGEKKHNDAVGLCKLADLVVPVGPRLEQSYSTYLRNSKKDIFVFTPGLFEREFGDLQQSPEEISKFKVLLCGRGDEEDFELKGYRIAAEAFTDPRLKQQPYELVFVGATEGRVEEIRSNLIRCGIDNDQLVVRKFIKSRKAMKDLLCEVDLSIMPSKSEGFGLVSLEALSAGLPILLGKKSGFAEALQKVPFGDTCIVDSDKPEKWAEAIVNVRVKDREMRLEEAKALRESYKERYSWEEQCRALVKKMWRMVDGKVSISFPSFFHSRMKQKVKIHPITFCS